MEPVTSNFERPSAVRAALSEIHEGSQATTLIRESTISHARNRLDICDDSFGTVALVKYERIRKAVEAARSRGIDVRFITEITSQNLHECVDLAKFVDLRHVDGIKGNFAVTDTEYYSFSALTRSTLPEEAIHSSQPSLVEHQQYIFQTLWGRAVPFEQKLREIEQGVPSPRIEISRDPSEIQRFFVELVSSAKTEVLFFFPTVEAFEREEIIGVIDALTNAVARGVSARIVSPVNERIESKIKAMIDSLQPGSGHVTHRAIDSPATRNTATILIVDRKVSFIIEQKDNSQRDFSKAIGHATYSTSQPSVSSSTLFFEVLWRETELRRNESTARQEEVRARRQSELLQDILTHDIRNYNQVIKLSSELLEEEFGDNEKATDIVRNMIDAVNGSTQLLERAKKLGKILSERKANLYPVTLQEVIRSSLATVQNAYPQKPIELHFENRVSGKASTKISILADDLLDEVFTNAFSNSVRYTDTTPVPVRVVAELVNENNTAGHRSVKVSVSDEGRGIPDEMKPNIFNRYLKSAKGTGLGMSIIHALVVERYHGKVDVKNAVPDDYTKGTLLEFTFQQGTP